MCSILRRTSRISWAPSGWFIEHPVNVKTTSFHFFTCPDDFYAARLGFANIGRASYKVIKAVAAPSTTANDFVNPTGGYPWIPFTFTNGGADVDSIVAHDLSATEISVACPAIAPHGKDSIVPRWTWTDWVPVASLHRTDKIDFPRIIMVRVLLPDDTMVTQPNGGFGGYFDTEEVNHGFDFGAGWMTGDFVDRPERIVENAIAADFGTARSTIACMQFLTKNRGLVGMTTGDSHHQGTTTTTQFLNYLLRSTITLGAKYIGKVPVGYVSSAVGGATSDAFFASLLALLPAVRPSFVVLPGWTFNDQSSTHAGRNANNLFLARLVQAADTCIMNGAVPIFLTPFPRDACSMTTGQVTAWLVLRKAILSMADAGAIVVDATSILGNKTSSGLLDGTYVTDLSVDGVHPNNSGHAALANALLVKLEQLAGLEDLDISPHEQ